MSQMKGKKMIDTPEIQDEIEEVLNEEKVEDVSRETPEEEPEKRKNRVSAGVRIGQFRKKLGDSERENDNLKQRIEELEKNQPKKEELKRPNEDDFDTHAEYMEATDNYIEDRADARADKKIKEANQKRDREFNEQQTQVDNEKIAVEWAKKQKKAVKKNSDFIEVENNFVADVRDSGAEHLFKDIMDCENSTDIVYYLGTNEDEFDRISSLGPRAALKEIGKLEDKLLLKANKKGDNTQYRPTPKVRGGAGTPKDLSRETQEEYNKRMNGIS